jgi:hypothetical protein
MIPGDACIRILRHTRFEWLQHCQAAFFTQQMEIALFMRSHPAETDRTLSEHDVVHQLQEL